MLVCRAPVVYRDGLVLLWSATCMCWVCTGRAGGVGVRCAYGACAERAGGGKEHGGVCITYVVHCALDTVPTAMLAMTTMMIAMMRLKMVTMMI